MKTVLLLVLSASLVAAGVPKKRGTEYYTKPKQPYSFSYFTQELPANEGLLKLLPTVQKAPVQQTPVQQLAVVPVYVENPIPIPIEHVPIISKVPVVYQYEEVARPNTYPHLKPYYKQVR
ncbi:unnamed protein product [Nezara viridula]|uniref:Neuropeptide n=1 Tax=Nezara viridula TaxID=85310 RepID=A0A9P0E9C4_NEZVI|nr:unnamed protein product [Nezara viridula]